MRWLIAILPRMRIIRLNLIRMPSITSDISMQLFKVIKCRQLDLTLDDVGSTVPSPAILDLMMSDRFDFLHDSPPDVVEQEWDCTKLNGFEKSLSLHVARLEDGGMNALVGALRKVRFKSEFYLTTRLYSALKQPNFRRPLNRNSGTRRSKSSSERYRSTLTRFRECATSTALPGSTLWWKTTMLETASKSVLLR